jgi:hypothetical protein
MSIRELIKKWEDDAELFDTNSDNEEVNIIRKTEKAMLHICIDQLKQCLADCKAEVDREIEGCKYNMMTKTNFEQGLYSGTLNGLQKLKKIYGGE